VALSYSIAGIEVVLEIPFENRAEFEILVVSTIVFDNKSYKEILSKKTGR
jgi:hypothetical protein